MMLSDLVWPRASIEIIDVISVIVRLVGSRAELLAIRDFASFGEFPGGHWIRKRQLAAPEGFIVSQARSGLPIASDLARVTDFPVAYGA